MVGTRDIELAAWGSQMRAAEAMREVVRVLDAAGVPFVPVKGFVTAQLLYDDIAERPIADIDVRVRPADMRRAIAAARAAGWTLGQRSTAYANAMFFVDGEMVDIETTIGPPGVCALRVDDLLARARPHEGRFGVRHLVPEIHDHALVTAVNVFKDKFVMVPPASIEDLERFARSPDLDTARLVARAREARVAAILWLVADWMRARDGASRRWTEIRDALGGDSPERRHYVRLWQRATRGMLEHNLASRIVARAASDSVGGQIAAPAIMVVERFERLARRFFG